MVDPQKDRQCGCTEFRLRAVALVRAGKPITRAAAELGISQGCLHNWVRQDRIDRGESKGISTKHSAELTRTNRRIRELESEVEILKRVSKFLGEDKPHPKGFTR
jgi:transposase